MFPEKMNRVSFSYYTDFLENEDMLKTKFEEEISKPTGLRGFIQNTVIRIVGSENLFVKKYLEN